MVRSLSVIWFKIFPSENFLASSMNLRSDFRALNLICLDITSSIKQISVCHFIISARPIPYFSTYKNALLMLSLGRPSKPRMIKAVKLVQPLYSSVAVVLWCDSWDECEFDGGHTSTTRIDLCPMPCRCPCDCIAWPNAELHRVCPRT